MTAYCAVGSFGLLYRKVEGTEGVSASWVAHDVTMALLKIFCLFAWSAVFWIAGEDVIIFPISDGRDS
jgi:hypothetical protein